MDPAQEGIQGIVKEVQSTYVLLDTSDGRTEPVTVGIDDKTTITMDPSPAPPGMVGMIIPPTRPLAEAIENLTRRIADATHPEPGVVTNELGGKQHALPYRFDLLEPYMMRRVSKVLAEGASRYGDRNWQRIPLKDHINHAMYHLNEANADVPETREDHLAHAICRIMFAMFFQLGPNEGKQ
jgi:hypothetical protein